MATSTFTIPWWGGPATLQQHKVADHLLECTQEAGLLPLLPPGTITREVHNSASTLDLVFGTRWIENRVWECRVDKDLDSGSDHYPIQTAISLTPPPRIPPVARPQWRKADWPKIKKSLEAGISTLPNSQITSPEEIDNFADSLTTAMTTVIDEGIPLSRPSTRASPAWSTESSALVHDARAARRVWTASGRTEDYVAFRTINNTKKRQIRRDLTKAWRRSVESATEKDSKF